MLRQRAAKSQDEEYTTKSSARDPPLKKKSSSGRNLIIVLSSVLFVLYIVIPFSVYSFPSVRRHAVFLNYVRLSHQKNLSRPSESGLECTRSFFISTIDNIKVGVWHVPPHSILHKCREGIIPEREEFNDDRPVFLYLHGNAGTRSGNHRVQLYKVLSQEVNAHIITFDYRGFGDSTNQSPTELGLVTDTKAVFDWLLKNKVSPSRIHVWGHSLGTGVGVAFLEKMLHAPEIPNSLILEAPFTSVIDAAKYHPLSIFHRYMPFFETLIAKPIGGEETGFNSITRIGKVKSSLLILHAEDDGFIPFEHGKQLYEEALSARQNSENFRHLITHFEGFEGHLDFGHKNIYKSPDLPNIIKKFLDRVGPH